MTTPSLDIHNLSLQQVDDMISTIRDQLSPEEQKEFTHDLMAIDEDYKENIKSISTLEALQSLSS